MTRPKRKADDASALFNTCIQGYHSVSSVLLFNKYSLSIDCVLGSVVSAGNVAKNKCFKGIIRNAFTESTT